MNLVPYTPRQTDLIISSIRKVMKTGDINNLTKLAYKFLYLASGFIAHYNLGGFCDEYADVEKLRFDIQRNQANNQWGNFRPGDADYDYYMQKRDIYNRICAAIETGKEDESFTDPTGVDYFNRQLSGMGLGHYSL